MPARKRSLPLKLKMFDILIFSLTFMSGELGRQEPRQQDHKHPARAKDARFQSCLDRTHGLIQFGRDRTRIKLSDCLGRCGRGRRVRVTGLCGKMRRNSCSQPFLAERSFSVLVGVSYRAICLSTLSLSLSLSLSATKNGT